MVLFGAPLAAVKVRKNLYQIALDKVKEEDSCFWLTKRGAR